jgi:spore germination protein KA
MSSLWNKLFGKKKSKRQAEDEPYDTDSEKKPISSSIKENVTKIKKEMGNSTDIIIREFHIGQNPKINAAALYIDGLADTTAINDFIMRSLIAESPDAGNHPPSSSKSLVESIGKDTLTLGDIKTVTDWNTFFLSVLSGDTAILIDGIPEAIIGSTRGGKVRSVTEPTSQTVVRGPKDGFTESIRTNTSLIRRRIKSPNLWLETIRLGEVTQTDVSLMYIKGIVNEELVDEIKSRLSRIKIDGILESGYIEQLIEDQTLTPFPTVYNTERPDVVAGNLLEGRVAILVDGTPFALIAPTSFSHFFQASEDYYYRYDIGSFLRMLRFLSFFISLLAPSLYVAAITYHQEMIPTMLLINLAAMREGIPFPAIVEAIMMEFTFEILREAGIRMPRAIGQAVSIVGALVIGQAAVEAGIVSTAMVIIVAITAIASFAVPSYNLAISARLLRFVFMVSASMFGLYGIALMLIFLVAHLCSLRSFGYPYLAPFTPFILSQQKDALIRLPLWAQLSRPRLLSENKNRMEPGLQPSPEHRDTENSTEKEGKKDD